MPVVPSIEQAEDREEGWIASGKGMGRSGASERVESVPIGDRGGRNNDRSGFPRLQRFPAPKTRRDQRREPLASGVAEGRESEG
jgi:hypothetical protein